MNPIDNNSSVRPQRGELEQGTRRSQEVASPAATATGVSASADNRGEAVSLSRAAADILALETQLRDLPGVDQARVEQFRQAIDSGSYEVDAGRIVDSLLQSERDLAP